MKSMIRSSPPVSRRLVSSSGRLLVNGLAPVPRAFSSPSSFLLDTSAGPDFLAVWPRLVKNFSELLENFGRCVKAVLIAGAALFRLVNAGVVCSAKRSSRSIAGTSCFRNGGGGFVVFGRRAAGGG